MDSLVARPATERDFVAFYGWRWPYTVRAMVVLIDERPVGIVGLSREGGFLKFFSDTLPELEPHLKRIRVLRTVKRVLQWAAESPLPVGAVSDNPALMARLGFVHEVGDEYVWAP